MILDFFLILEALPSAKCAGFRHWGPVSDSSLLWKKKDLITKGVRVVY